MGGLNSLGLVKALWVPQQEDRGSLSCNPKAV